MATSSNPFKPATKVSKKLKVLIYGLPGTGKTRAALSFPRPAVIDSEGGTDLYAGRDGIPDFSVMRAKTMDELFSAIAFIQSDNGKTFDTLVIDSLTVFYDVQKDAAAKTAGNGEMNMKLWNRVNGRMNTLYITLMNLPIHVVVIAAETDLFEGEGLNLKRTGSKPDSDKKVMRAFDFVIRMLEDHSAKVIKSRGVGLGATIPAVVWDVFAQSAGMFTDGNTLLLQDDNAAAQRDSIAYSDHWSQSQERLDALYKWAFDSYKATREDVNKAIQNTGYQIGELSEKGAAEAVAGYTQVKRAAAKEAN